MANLWIDGLSRYGGQTARMLESGPAQGWIQLGGGISLTTAQRRSGTHSLQFNGTAGSTTRRIFGQNLNECFVGFAFRASTLPTSEPVFGGEARGVVLAQFRDSSNSIQCTVALGTDGSIIAMTRGANNTLGNLLASSLGRSDPVIGAGVWQYIEIYVKIGLTDGAMTIRVNENTVLEVTDVNTQFTGIDTTTQFSIGSFAFAGGGGPYNWTDFYANDTVDDGSLCNTFLGDVQIVSVFPNGDTPVADFTPSTGTDGFPLINSAPPVDSTFIGAPEAPARSDFELEDSPPDAVQILTVRPFARVRKEEAGAANILMRMNSGTSDSPGISQPVSTAFAYYDSNVPLNPATGLPWTPDEINSARLIVERDL